MWTDLEIIVLLAEVGVIALAYFLTLLGIGYRRTP